MDECRPWMGVVATKATPLGNRYRRVSYSPDTGHNGLEKYQRIIFVQIVGSLTMKKRHSSYFECSSDSGANCLWRVVPAGQCPSTYRMAKRRERNPQTFMAGNLGWSFSDVTGVGRRRT